MGYRRAKEDKRRLKKLYSETKHGCCAGAFYSDKKHRYIKVNASNTPGLSKYLRRKSNRRVRKNEIPAKGCYHKKLFDYWWVLY